MTPQDSEQGDRPSALTPVERERAKLGAASSAAAGMAGVQKGLGMGLREMGLLRSARTLLKLNQREGFDCQSCAWPNPDGHRHVAEFCENGIKAVADEATTKRIDAAFFREHSVADLALRTDHWLGGQGRLTEPMVLRPGSRHYEPISWGEAFAVVAAELRALESPEEAAFYTSGRTSNEAAFMYQLFVRAYGTNNLPDCSNMCHESSGSALGPMIGIGKGCVTLGDFEKADAIFVLGQNPGTNHPRMLTALQLAKARGCRIVSLNPLPEVGLEWFKNPQDLANPVKAVKLLFGRGTAISDLWLPVRINGDMAAMQGIMKELVSDDDREPGRGVIDWEFIRGHAQGAEALVAQLRSVGWDSILALSGLTREQIRAAADIAKGAKSIIACWAMGLTQHRNAVATIQEVVNFLLLRGNIGRPGAGPCPVRGHSNVQGDRTMGIYEKPSPSFLDRLASEFSFEPPRGEGLDVVGSIRAMHEGKVRVFFAMGGNFLSASPDTDFTAEALSRCSLTSHVSTKLNRSHLVCGRTALILPCLGRSEVDAQEAGEQFVTVEDSMGVISSSRGVLAPASDKLLSEPAIVAGLAEAVLGPGFPVPWRTLAADYDRVRGHIERVVPGFEDFNRRIREGTFYLPNAARDHRKFGGPGDRATFVAHELSGVAAEPGRLVMMTIRSHDQFNTTIYGLDDRYRGVFNGRRVVFMNPDDVREMGLVQGQWVDLIGHFGGNERVAPRFMVAPYPIVRGAAATYFPEANVLVPVESVAEVSNTPTSKSVVISVRPSAEAGEARSAPSAADHS